MAVRGLVLHFMAQASNKKKMELFDSFDEQRKKMGSKKGQRACRKHANASARKADLGASMGAADIRTVPKLANLHQKPN